MTPGSENNKEGDVLCQFKRKVWFSSGLLNQDAWYGCVGTKVFVKMKAK